MPDLVQEFLAELDNSIENKKTRQRRHRILQVVLSIAMAVCGFLTAAASQAEGKDSGLSSPTLLLSIGLIGAICAILNQVLAPGEKSSYHRNCKKALQSIRGKVKYGGMAVSEAENLRARAVATPDSQGLMNEFRELRETPAP